MTSTPSRPSGAATSRTSGLHAVRSGGPEAETLAALAERAETTRLRRNDVLYAEGDPAGELYIIQTGRIALVRRTDEGREWFASLSGDGDVLGVTGLFDGTPRSEQARALAPSVVLAVGYGPVRRMLEERPALLWSMGRLLSGRLRGARRASADLVSLDLTARTAKCLLELAGPADEFKLPLTQEELASMVGASRERVNKAIAGFARLGWLEQRGRRYTIHDRDQLRRRARTE